VVGWTQGADNLTVEADSNGSGSSAIVAYTLFKNGTASTTSPTGSFNTGPNGTIVWTLPAALIGNPAHGTQLTNPFANDRGVIAVQGGGLQYTAAADGAPPDSNAANPGFGADYFLSVGCLNPNIPEAPVVPPIAMIGGALTVGVGTRRYRRRTAAVA
jgi:hypothetical protein